MGRNKDGDFGGEQPEKMRILIGKQTLNGEGYQNMLFPNMCLTQKHGAEYN